MLADIIEYVTRFAKTKQKHILSVQKFYVMKSIRIQLEWSYDSSYENNILVWIFYFSIYKILYDRVK